MYVCIRICVCVYVYIHTYLHICIYIRTYIHTHIHTYIDIDRFSYIHHAEPRVRGQWGVYCTGTQGACGTGQSSANPTPDGMFVGSTGGEPLSVLRKANPRHRGAMPGHHVLDLALLHIPYVHFLILIPRSQHPPTRARGTGGTRRTEGTRGTSPSSHPSGRWERGGKGKSF